MDSKVNGYQRSLGDMVYKFFNERTKGSGIENKQLAEELHKPTIRNFKRRKVYSSFKDNIWGVFIVSIYCVLIYFQDMLGLFLSKIKKVIALLKNSKVF